jgi:hypothetical protein
MGGNLFSIEICRGIYGSGARITYDSALETHVSGSYTNTRRSLCLSESCTESPAAVLCYDHRFYSISNSRFDTSRGRIQISSSVQSLEHRCPLQQGCPYLALSGLTYCGTKSGLFGPFASFRGQVWGCVLPLVRLGRRYPSGPTHLAAGAIFWVNVYFIKISLKIEKNST